MGGSSHRWAAFAGEVWGRSGLSWPARRLMSDESCAGRPSASAGEQEEVGQADLPDAPWPAEHLWLRGRAVLLPHRVAPAVHPVLVTLELDGCLEVLQGAPERGRGVVLDGPVAHQVRDGPQAHLVVAAGGEAPGEVQRGMGGER